jgi:hypothetical protein
MKARWVVGGLAVMAIAATCGGDGSTFSSGVDKGSELGSLSSGDAQKLCTALNDWMKNNLSAQIKEMSCRVAGLAASGFGGSSAAQKQAACTTAYDQCMKQPEETDSTGDCTKPPATCKATVGELEACVNDFMPLMQQFVSSFPTCQQLSSGTGSVPTNLQPPQSCTAFQSKCQDLDLPTSVGEF